MTKEDLIDCRERKGYATTKNRSDASIEQISDFLVANSRCSTECNNQIRMNIGGIYSNKSKLIDFKMSVVKVEYFFFLNASKADRFRSLKSF